MSLVSDEEYTRVHSHVEFLVNPDTLVAHCARLRSGEEQFPSGGDLLKTFLAEASDQDEKQKVVGVRSLNFRKLALRVFQLMQYEIDDLEALLNFKYQKKMISTILELDSGVHAWLLKHRWTLRSLSRNETLKSLNPPSSRPFSPPFSNKDYSDAISYISQWLNDDYAMTKAGPKFCFALLFEMADFSFSVESYSTALAFTKRALHILNTSTELAEETLQARAHQPLKKIPTLLQHSTIVGASTLTIPRSSLALPLISDKLRGIERVIEAMENPNHPDLSSATFQLNHLSHNLDSDASSGAEIADVLASDNENPHMSFSSRLLLESLPLLDIHHGKVIELNLLWRLEQSNEVPSPLWLTGVDLTKSGRPILEALLASWKRIGAPENKLPAYSELASILCRELNEDKCWQLVKNEAPDLVTSASFETASSAFTCAVVRDQMASMASPLAVSTFSSDFDTLTSSGDAELLLQSARRLFSQTSGHELVPAILLQRSQQYESTSRYAEAMKMYNALQGAMENSPSPQLLWGRLLASIELNQKSIDSSDVLDEIEKLLERSIYPSTSHMEHILAIFVDRWQLVGFSSFSSLVSRHFANRSQSLSTYHAPLLLLISVVDHMMKLQETSYSLQPGVETEKVNLAFADAAVHFDALLQAAMREPELIYRLIQRLKYVPLLTTLAAISLFSLAHLYTSARIPCAIHFDRISKHSASVSAERGHHWLSAAKSVVLAEESKIQDFALFCLQRLLQTSPNSSPTAYALADLQLHRKQFSIAMRYYLLAGALAHFQLDATDFCNALPSLIACFVEAKLYHYAIILHQYVQKVDYANALPLCTTWGHLLQFEQISFLFDLSIMEALVYTLKRHGHMTKVHAIVERISKPDISGEQRSKNDISKRRFFHLLAQQFLDGGNWT